MKRVHYRLDSSLVRAARRCALALPLACLAGCHDESSDFVVSDDAELVALSVSAGALSTVFDPATTDYDVSTLSGVAATTITATTSDPGATLEIAGLPAVSGAPSQPVPLVLGTNSVAVVVTAEDGTTTKTYTIAVERVPFALVLTNVMDFGTWQINREMHFRFNEDVDFSTVGLNTIRIETTTGVPAVGTFHLRDPDLVVFQPACPLREDLADAGLQPGSVPYVLRVVGSVGGATNTVRSTSGGLLQVTEVRNFFTPLASAPFLDTEVGPPFPVVREQGSADEDATYLELGGDPDQRVYFERTPTQEFVLSVPGFEAPLNLYSDASTRVAFVLAFNQPIRPWSANLSQLRLQYLDGTTWLPLETRATLLANCAGTGAKVRLEPRTILPQATFLRAVVLDGFEDLVGEVILAAIDDFARVPTLTVGFTSLLPGELESDELLEGFDLGRESPETLLDTAAVFDVPPADWGGGRLTAAFAFDGTGGPNGTFDWVVRQGEFFLFDTTVTPILGGPGGAPIVVVFANEGFVDVRNLTIEEGGELRVQGPNPLVIHATGEVRIEGRLDVSGFNAKDVATLNTGNIVERGGAGAAGGGRGGDANLNVAGPTPRGGRGQGPFAQADRGGQGGEMGFSSIANKNARRPGGGGGGRFANDWIGTATFSAVALAAEAGGDGNPSSTGAETGLSPAAGGAPGEGPFVDADVGNDFFGIRPVVTGGEITALVRGELPRVWAGHGGGGGGNAGRFFPNPNWNFTSDEKGGPGGGGGGALTVKALGRIVFGRAGEIVANGGRGGTGENTNFLDHIGGTGGGGSGGHVLLESATSVDFTDGGANLDVPSRDFVQAAGPLRKTGPIVDVDTCGESSLCCPDGCRDNSNGGAGGAGVIQIHVQDPTAPPDSLPAADIRVPEAALQAEDVLDQLTSPPAHVLLPTLATRSKARSRWISIGEADHGSGGTRDLVRFLFGGVQTSGADEGKILVTGDAVPEMAPLLIVDMEASASVAILPDGITLAFRGKALEPFVNGTIAGVSSDLYLRTPALLREFVLRIDAGATVADFVVAGAVYDEGSAAPGDEELRITVAPGPAGTPRSFFDLHVGEPGGIDCSLIPRFFRVTTAGTESFLPGNSFVRILFQAAGQDATGGVDEENPLVDWTADLSRFHALAPGLLRYFRFQVELELDAAAAGPSAATEPVSLDFLRIPFVF